MRSRGRRGRRRRRLRSGRRWRGRRRGGDRRLRERGLPGTTGEVGGRERRPEVEVAPILAVPGSLAVEAGVTGRGRRRTSGRPSLEAAQTETTDVVILPGVDRLHPGVVHLHPGVARPLPGNVAAPGGGRDRTGQIALHQDVTGDSRAREPGDKVELAQRLAVAEILVTEDLHPGVMLGMVEMVQPDALLTVMSGDVEELEDQEVQTVPHPAVVDVIVTLVVLEQADVIATLVPETLLLPAATTPDLEMTDPRTGVQVRLVVESVNLSLERRNQGWRDRERRDREKDQLASLMKAGPKSSVNPFPININLLGQNSLSSVAILANPTLNFD